MKNGILKNLLPHIIAILVFLVVAVIFCKPVLDGNVLSQHDIVNWKGMAQNAFEYKEKNGHFPLWNTNLFAGMPNYQIAMEGKSVMPDMSNILALGQLFLLYTFTDIEYPPGGGHTGCIGLCILNI
jgi:hypothetical protein